MSESGVKLTKLARCAGCGAKVGAGTLASLLGGLEVRRDPDLLVGYDRSDDASVYRVSDEVAIINTVDFFPPMVDDPFIFGQIAAANALSDIYAMGGEPRVAQNILAVPQNMPGEDVRAILRGGYSKVYEAGAVITGGHSIFDEEPKYGLAVTGFVRPDRYIANCGARPGDRLILTKPLGLGIMNTAIKAGFASPEGEARAVELMTALNRAARDIMVKYEVHAATDVTGFSLLGHGVEMAEGSGVTLEIAPAAVDIIPEALEHAKMGLLPEGMYRNREFAGPRVDTGGVPLHICDALFDPQTSGGLLIAVAPKDTAGLLAELAPAVPSARLIGRAVEKRDRAIELRDVKF